MSRRMKDSGIEWIGEIPEHWNTTKLKRKITCFDGRRRPVSSDLRESGEYPYWGAGSITDYVNDYLFDEEIVLLGEDGAPFFDKIRDVAFYVNEKVWVNNHIHVIKPDEDINAKYLTHFLNIVDFGSYINGSILNKLTQSNMNNINLIIPNIHEQQKIAKFLDKKVAEIDHILEMTRESIEEYKEYKQAIITEAVTKGLNPDVNMKDSGIEWIGEIPEDWEISKIKYVTNISRGLFNHRPRNDERFYGGEYPFIQTGDVAKANKYITTYSQTLNELGKSVSKEFPKGTLVMTIAANIGDIAVLNFDAYFPDSVIGFIPFSEYHWNYLYYIFIAMKTAFVNASIVSTQMNLNIDRVKELHLPITFDISEQLAIARYLDNKCEEINGLMLKKEDLIENLKEYKKSLIYEYVTGKREVI